MSKDAKADVHERALLPTRRIRFATTALLAVAVLVVFRGVLECDWILFDDPVYVTRNPHVMHGLTWSGFTWFFHSIHGGNWHPLTSWSHLLDAELFGASPRGPHAVNLALHAINACLLLHVLGVYTGRWWRSLVVAALFALHPLRVESVAWISERKDVLSALFFFLALLAYERWVRTPSTRTRALLVAAFVLGLLAKPMLVTLPFLLLLLDAWPLGRLRLDPRPRWKPDVWPLVREKRVLFALSFIFAALTFVVQRASGATSSLEQIPLAVRISNAVIAYGRYVWKSLAPRDLAVFYPYDRQVPLILPIAMLAALVIVTAICWRLWRSRPYLIVGWLWYVGSLVPVIGLVQVGSQSHADRYTYIPLIGIAVALVWAIGDLSKRWVPARVAAMAVAACALVWFAASTQAQVARWKDSLTLFAHTLSVTHDNALARQVYGNALLSVGETDAAIVNLEEALRLYPDFPDAHNNLGSALGVKGRFEEAIAHFRAAQRTQDTVDVHHNLGFALARLNRFDEAIEEYRRALEIEPEHIGANSKLGLALGAQGRLDEALVQLRRTLDLAPREIETRRSLAVTLTLKDRVEEAIVEYRRLLELQPDDLDALNNIAWIRATHTDPAHRDSREAVLLAERARALSHAPVAVLFSTLAAAYAADGRMQDAITAGTRAVEIARDQGELADAERFASQVESFRAGRPLHVR